MILVFCHKCHEGYRHQGGDLPDICPRCLYVHPIWMTEQPYRLPAWPYAITQWDVRFLKALWIFPEVDLCKTAQTSP